MSVDKSVKKYLADAKTKNNRYIKKIFLPNEYYPNPDVARIRKDMKIDVFRNNKLYISICPREKGRIWVLDWYENWDEPSVCDSLDPKDFENYTEVIDTIIRRNQIATWVDFEPMKDELYAMYMAHIMGGCDVL